MYIYIYISIYIYIYIHCISWRRRRSALGRRGLLSQNVLLAHPSWVDIYAHPRYVTAVFVLNSFVLKHSKASISGDGYPISCSRPLGTTY